MTKTLLVSPRDGILVCLESVKEFAWFKPFVEACSGRIFDPLGKRDIELTGGAFSVIVRLETVHDDEVQRFVQALHDAGASVISDTPGVKQNGRQVTVTVNM